MLRLLEKIGLTASRETREKSGTIHSRLRLQLAHLGGERLEYLAAFAGLLARAAHGDSEVSPAEQRALARLLREHAGLPDAEARLVADIAAHETEALSGIENHLLTRAFNEHAAPDQKQALIECLYAVTAADRMVSDAEDREIRRIASALLVPRSTLMAIRSRYRDDLEVVQKMRELKRSSTARRKS